MLKFIVPQSPKSHFKSSCLGKDTTDNGDESSTNTLFNDLSHEENRFNTFDASWPHTFISPRILAKTGFYYIGPHDSVKCYFCRVEVKCWEYGDNELDEHIRWSSNCPLLKRNETTNVALEPLSELNELLPPISYDVCGTYAAIDRREDAYPETTFVPSSDVDIIEDIVANLNVVEHELTQTQTFKHPDFPEFAIETARLRSFDEWPKTMRQKPKQLSDAGFFYTQKGDRVICFSCGGGLRDWDEHDDPWEQHALWYDRCDYLRLVKGLEFIDTIKTKFGQNENCKSISSLSTQESVESSCSSSSSLSELSKNDLQASSDSDDQNAKLDDSRLCKICYLSEYNAVFDPCGHMMACTKCASSVIKCPVCRKPFDRIIRVFFS